MNISAHLGFISDERNTRNTPNLSNLLHDELHWLDVILTGLVVLMMYRRIRGTAPQYNL